MNDFKEMEVELGQIIKTIAYYEMSIERLKIKVAQDLNFDIYEAWKFLDKMEFDVIYSQDIIRFLSVYNIACSEKDAQYLLNIKSVENEKMNFETFIATVLPETDGGLKTKQLNRKNQQVNQMGGYFRDEIIIKQSGLWLSRIFQKEIQFYREIEDKKNDFYRNLRFRVIDLMKNFDTENTGIMTQNSVIKFMTKQKLYFTVEEYQSLLRRLNIQQDQNIDIVKFLDYVIPSAISNYADNIGNSHNQNQKSIISKRGFDYETLQKSDMDYVKQSMGNYDPIDPYDNMQKYYEKDSGWNNYSHTYKYPKTKNLENYAEKDKFDEYEAPPKEDTTTADFIKDYKLNSMYERNYCIQNTDTQVNDIVQQKQNNYYKNTMVRTMQDYYQPLSAQIHENKQNFTQYRDYSLTYQRSIQEPKKYTDYFKYDQNIQNNQDQKSKTEYRFKERSKYLQQKNQEPEVQMQYRQFLPGNYFKPIQQYEKSQILDSVQQQNSTYQYINQNQSYQ